MPDPTALITLAETLKRAGLSRATCYRYRRDGKFPAPVTFGHPRAVMFRADQVDIWCRANQRGA